MMKQLIQSIKNAVKGILGAGEQTNIRILSFCFAATVIMGFAFRIDIYEWIAVVIMSALVLSLELINTSLELMGDRITKSFDPQIGRIKDIAAGAVLLSTFFALVVGLLIFIPKVVRYWPR